MSEIQELLDDIRLIRESLQSLHQNVAALSLRVQEQGPPVKRADLDGLLARVKQEASFTLDEESVAERIQAHLATPAKLEAAMATGLRQLEQLIKSIPLFTRLEGEVWGFTSWRTGGLVSGLLLLLAFVTRCAPDGRVPVEKFEQLQQQQAWTQYQLNLMRAGRARLFKEAPLVARSYFPYASDSKLQPAPPALPRPSKSPPRRLTRHLTRRSKSSR